MNKQQLASKIWESANQMRSKIEANEYKDYILGFIFYKYLSDFEVRFAQGEGMSEAEIRDLSEDDADVVKHVRESIGYFIAHKDLFSTWIGLGKDFNVSNVRDALSAFGRLINPNHKKVFGGIFTTLETGLSKLGDSAASQTKAIAGLLQLIKDIPMDGRQDYDVLGFIYEYLIGMFAANAGKKAGEFYTPHEVSLLMSEVVAHHLKDRTPIEIYDPTSGSGSLLINIGRSLAKHLADTNAVKYYAQELKQNTYNLTRMNLVMRGILVDNIVTRNGDTLEDDWPYFDENDPSRYEPLYVDAVVSNPPYSQKWDPAHKDADPRYKFGLAPKSKADYAFLLHDLYHLKPDGIMTIVLPHGVLFRGGEEGGIRKQLVEGNHIDAVIGLPANIFFGTGIPTVILVLRQKRNLDDVLIVDASKGYEKVGKTNKLRASDIKRIADTVVQRQTTPGFSRVVGREEIRSKANNYNLNIPRYVDSSAPAEVWDVYASMFGGVPTAEVDSLAAWWAAFPGLREALFGRPQGPYATLAVTDIRATVAGHPSVNAWVDRFTRAFADFDQLVYRRLVTNLSTLSVAQEETVLGAEIFRRLDGVPLVDPYAAYQVLADHWTAIEVDLEILQTEGLAAAKRVDPRLVTKKKDGKDVEVQDGWVGRVLPFDLVQNVLLIDELKRLKKLDEEVSRCQSDLEDLLEQFGDDERESDAFNDDKDGFVAPGVAKEAKDLRADVKNGVVYADDGYEARLMKADDLLRQQKAAKTVRAEIAAALHAQTKTTIEALGDERIRDLLERKWIAPLVAGLHQLPQAEIATLVARVKALTDKYATTYQAVTDDIHTTEQALAALLGELTGNDHDRKGLAEFRRLLGGE